MSDLLELANEIESLARKASVGPWKADVIANIGDNWLIAFLGTDANVSADHIVTTDCVHASEATSEPETDARLIALMVNRARTIVQALRHAAVAADP